MRTLFLAVLGLLLAAPPSGAVEAEIVGTVSSVDGDLVRTEATVQVGDNPLDQFKMIRLAQGLPSQGATAQGDTGQGNTRQGNTRQGLAVRRRRSSVLLLPPAGFSFTFYELRDDGQALDRTKACDDLTGDTLSACVASHRHRDSLAQFLARHGYDVYGYSPRVDGVPAGSCEAGVLDCSVMATWDLQSLVDDAAFIRAWIEELNPGSEVAVVGLSLGAMQAIATVNAHPEDYDALVIWEGLLSSQDPAVIAQSEPYCTALNFVIDGGDLFDGVTFNVFQELGHRAELTPAGLTSNPLFPSIFTNQQALVAALALPTPGPLSMPVPGYLLARGSLGETFHLYFASEARLHASATHLYDYFPLATLRDVHCSFAGLDTQHTANLGSFPGPVLAIGAGHGYGPYMQDQLDRFTSPDVEMLFREEFGHLDHYFSPWHRNLLDRPLLDWLRKTLP